MALAAGIGETEVRRREGLAAVFQHDQRRRRALRRTVDRRDINRHSDRFAIELAVSGHVAEASLAVKVGIRRKCDRAVGVEHDLATENADHRLDDQCIAIRVLVIVEQLAGGEDPDLILDCSDLVGQRNRSPIDAGDRVAVTRTRDRDRKSLCRQRTVCTLDGVGEVVERSLAIEHVVGVVTAQRVDVVTRLLHDQCAVLAHHGQ